MYIAKTASVPVVGTTMGGAGRRRTASLARRPLAALLGVVLVGVALVGLSPVVALALPFGGEAPVTAPAPLLDETRPAAASSETIVLAGGCFWGVQKVFQHVKGVQRAVSGYAGGSKRNAEYETVSNGTTGHAESVEITYDPAQVSLGTLLRVYFSVAHNPTELNRQGPDTGTQYRSAIFTNNPEQMRIAQSYIKQLDATPLYGRPIVTRIEPLPAFYPAENYHQDYATRHPESGYIVFNDLPKVRNLEQLFPQLYRRDPVLVAGANH